ncbi:MAG: ATP-dependent RNA helicase HrpA [Pseudomonadales bacterium]
MHNLPDTIDTQIDELMLADQARLRRKLRQFQRQARRGHSGAKLAQSIHQQLAAGIERIAQRRQRMPDITYPPQLPVTAHVEELLAALQRHQVIIVAGHTGSGKSTQLPKICLAAGRGVVGQIAHTQPRRLAARSVAQRIADEVQQELGTGIGFQVRFSKTYSEHTLVKVMTDGVLLNEIENDPELLRYDTIIIDEAHERTLNIDFLIAYAKQLLPKRPELKLLITSATIDTQRFADYFDQAPVIEVSGNLYPIDVRYRPAEFYGLQEDVDLADHIQLALQELQQETNGVQHGPRDILVFLTSEQEIRDAQQRLRAKFGDKLEILPLYARLPQKEQQKVFNAPKSQAPQRLILATNVAETSLTVPGIRYVIDAGFARLSRYSYRSKIQRLPIEPISQANADQRKGRCGRLATGICIRLYSEEDFNARPEFIEPEILRTNLAAVILKLLSIGIHDSATFPFIQAPESKQLSDGVRLLQELHAVDEHGHLTKVGRTLARLPVEPRLGRVLIAGVEHDCLQEMLVIAAALSVVDPRERPLAKQQEADALHARFTDARSDFISLLKLWRYVESKRRTMSGSQFAKSMRKEFLSPTRIRDWRDIHAQLLSMTQDLRLTGNKRQAKYAAVHQSLLSGFVTHVGLRENRKEYRGVRNRRFKLFPGSGLYARPPHWLLAAELVETQTLYARTAADVRVAWIAHAARHLCTTEFAEPHWDIASERVMVYAKRKLYGLVIADRDKVAYRSINPVVAREVFIRTALVEQQWHAPYAFFQHNQQSLHAAWDIVARLRRPELLKDADDILYDAYDGVLPSEVADAASFKKWAAKQTQQRMDALQVAAQQLLSEPIGTDLLQQFPDTLHWNGNEFALRYQCAPGEPDDGVQVLLPQHLLAFVPNDLFMRLVPGMLRQKCVQLLKALPKATRKQLAPVPDAVDDIFPRLQESSEPLLEQLAELIWLTRKVRIEASDWRFEQLPPEFCILYSIVDQYDEQVTSGRDLAQIKRDAGGMEQGQAWFFLERFDGREVRHDSIPELPAEHAFKRAKLQYTAYPGLFVDAQVVRCCLFHRLEDARRHSAWALALLATKARREQAKTMRKNLFNSNTARLHLSLISDHREFVDDCVCRVFYVAYDCVVQWPVSPTQFDNCLRQGNTNLYLHMESLEKLFEQLLASHFALCRALDKVNANRYEGMLADVNKQLQRLVYPGFVRLTPTRWLQHYPRFLQAACYRVERIEQHGKRDALLTEKLQPWLQRCASADLSDANDLLPWLVEEYRVSLFAQHLKTSIPVSATRLQQLWQSRSDDVA